MYKLFNNCKSSYKKIFYYEFLNLKKIKFDINFYEYFRLSLDERNNYGKSSQIK